MDVNDIITKVKQGSRSAERLLYDHMSPYILEICRRYARDDSIAKDYFQECFIRMFEKISQFDISKGNFRSWFSRLAINKIISMKRKEKLLISFEDYPIIHESKEEIEEYQYDFDSEIILEGIRSLPEGFKTILNLYIYERKSHKEIAIVLGISESTSRSQYHRAKKRLKIFLINKDPILHETGSI